MIIKVIAKTIKLIEASGSVFLLEVTAMFSEPKVTHSVKRGSAAHTTCKFKTKSCGLLCFNNIERFKFFGQFDLSLVFFPLIVTSVSIKIIGIKITLGDCNCVTHGVPMS